MIKEKRILSYFLGWLIVGFCIIFVGVNNVFALNVNSEYVKIFDNYGTSLTEVTTAKVTSPKTYWTGTITKIIANSYGGAIIIQTESPLAKGVNYSLSINLNICSTDGSDCYNTAISSKFNLGIGTGIQNTKDSYFNNTGTEILSKEKTGSYIYYNFTTKTNGSYILIPFTTETSCNNGCIVEYYGYELISNGLASELSSSDITNITNSQTNELNNSIQNSTDTITGEINDMEQSIVDSNKETQEVIKDQFNDCHTSYNLLNYSVTSKTNNGINYTVNNDNTITLSGTATADSSFYLYTVNNPLNLKAGTYTLSGVSGGSNVTYKMLSYDTNWTLITQDTGNGGTFTINQDLNIFLYIWVKSGQTVNTTIKPMLNEGSTSKPYEPYGEEICSNKIDKTNDKLDNITGALTDSSPTDMSGLGDSAGWLPAGPVDSILTLPLTMLNNLVNNLSSDSCQTATLKLPYVKTNINLPCIKTLYEKIGITGTLFQSAGLIASAFILFNYLLKLYQWVDATLTMRENTMPGYFDDNWGGGA